MIHKKMVLAKWTMAALLTLMAAARGTVHTVTLDFDEVRNVLADPGFELMSGTEPDAVSAPWFTSGEDSPSNFRISADQAFSGNQSAVFAEYGDKGALVQNLEMPLNWTRYCRLTVWMRTDDPSGDAAHTNTPALNATLYTSPTEGGTYTYRAGFFWGQTTSIGGGWEKIEGTISGADLSDSAGEYMQLRLVKVSENSSHKMYIDTVSLTESDSPPKTVSRYLVGANIVYSKDEGPDWEAKNKVDVLKRAGMSNLRYPGGHVVSYWDWEFPYHNAYANFWDPGYTLTQAQSNDLFEANQHRLSLDEHLDLCRETGAVPVIGINMFQGYRNNRDADSVAKAVRLVNYVKTKISGPKYYFLDNEAGHQPENNNHVPIDDYLPLIPDYSTAIKAADPEAKIAVNIMHWHRVEEIVRDYGDHVDLYDQHWYYNNITWGQFWPEEWRADVNMGDYTSRLNQFNNWINTYNKPHLKMGFLEWNLGPSTGAEGSAPGNVFFQGLVQADMLMHMIRFDVHMGSLWPLTWDDNFRNLIDGPAHTVSPAVYIHRALSKAAGGMVVSMDAPDAAGQLRSLAVKSADEAFIDLYFLNKSTDAIDLDIELPVPIVEVQLMTFAQGAGDDASVYEQHTALDSSVLPLSLGDTSFTHIRCRISDKPANYKLFEDDFESSIDAGNVASAPYPVGSWHHQGTAAWQTEGSAESVDMGEFNGGAGHELRLGWGYDEVVALYSTLTPIHTSQTYTFRGRWEIGNVVDEPRGFIAGIVEFSADDGSLVQRLTPDSLVFGNTNAPVLGEKGTFEVTLDAVDLTAAGTAPGNRIGVFFHHNNGDDQLYGDSNTLRNDVYYIDNVTLEVNGSITQLDQWMVSNKVAGEESDPDGDGVDNRTEYWFGGDPAIDDAAIILPTFGMVPDLGTDWVEYVYRRRSDYQMRGLNYTVETATNLASGAWSTGGVVDAGTGAIGAGMDSVTNRVSTEEQPAQFIRLRVE